MKIVKFGSVGAISTIFSYLVFWGLIHLNVYYLLASTLSFLAGTVINYFMNAKYTFSSLPNARALLKFLAIMTVSLSTSLFLLYLFTDIVGVQVLIAQIFVVLVRFPINYLLVKCLVFNRLPTR